MLPSEEEVSRIEEAQELQPDIPLGTAEQFLLTLSSISGLEARLRLWAFKMDFEVLEREITEPLGDLKTGLDLLVKNPTFKTILNVTLNIGNFLNGTSSRGFSVEYLGKVPEVKDTIHKHSLLYHLTFCVLESLPTASDLYSEIGPITRASRTDFEELDSTLSRMEEECKNSWDYLKIISKYDNVQTENESGSKSLCKTTEFLTDAAERIIIMQTVYKRVMKKYTKFLLWLGIPKHSTGDHKVHHICKTISEFSLEFRTVRERVQQTIAKKKQAKERNKSRTKLHELMKRHGQTKEEKEAEELQAILGTQLRIADGETLHRKKKKHRTREEIERREHHRRRKEAREVNENEVVSGVLEVRRPRQHPKPGEETEDMSRVEDTTSERRREHGQHRRRRTKEEGSAAVSEEGVDGHHRRRRPKEEGTGDASEKGVDDDDLQAKMERREKREKHRERHRQKTSVVGEQTVQLADGKVVPETEVDAGLFESLMDMGTLRRNKQGRRSTKHRESSRKSSDLKRSRTREGVDLLEVEEK